MKKAVLAILMAFVLLFAACGGGQGSSAAAGETSTASVSTSGGETDATVETGEKSLVFGSVGYFYTTSWDPSVDWEGWAIGSYGVGETLFRLDENYEAHPWLAESAEQQNDTTWTITLREGVQFHNEAAMTAEAVKKCFERTMEQNERMTAVLPIASMEAEGQTLTIHLNRPAPNILNDLCDPLLLVYDADGSEDFDTETFFTGPYIPVSFSPNDELVVEKNENYWGDAPQLDKAVFKTVSDVDTLTMAYQNGEVDIVVPLPDESVPLFEDDPTAVIDSRTSTRVQMYRFNMDSPVVQDVNVRNAIAYCIDRENYCDVIAHGIAQASYGVFPEQLPFGGTKGLDVTVDAFDPEAASALLKAAGYKDTDGDGVLEKNGQPLSLRMIALSAQTGQVQLCEVMQDQLSQIGIEVDLQVLENINDARAAGDFDISCESYSMAATGNPQAFISEMFASGGTTNVGHYANAEVDALVEELMSLEDEARQDEIIAEINQHLLDEAPFIFFAHKKFTGLYNSETVAFYESQPSEYYILDSTTAAR